MAVTTDVSFSYGISNSFDNIEMTITNWGNLDPATQDPNNLSVQIPDQQFSIFGVAIAPQSRVDRCLIRTGTNGVWSQSGRLISVDQPYFGSIPSPWTILSASTPEVQFKGTFVEINNPEATTTTFGPAMGNDSAGNPIFQNNILVLRLYLSPVNNISQSTRPSYTEQNAATVGSGVLRAWPVHGRSKARVNLKVYGDAGSAADIRLTALSYGVTTASMNEAPLTNLINMPLDTQQTFLLDLQASWLLLHADISANAPTIQWSMTSS